MGGGQKNAFQYCIRQRDLEGDYGSLVAEECCYELCNAAAARNSICCFRHFASRLNYGGRFQALDEIIYYRCPICKRADAKHNFQ